MSTISRPTIPYISLDDPHTKDFFTKSRIQKHLRRAGLLNRNGEILTQAEYDNKQTNVAIGHENRRKLNDVIIEVLNNMAREHWAFARDHMEDMKINVRHDFRRVEKKYSRRTQPITIRHSYDRRPQANPSNSQVDNQTNITENSTSSNIPNLPPISSANPSQPSNNPRATELDSIRQELNELKNKLANFNQLNTNSKRDKNDASLLQVIQLLLKLENQQDSIQEHQKILIRQYDEEKQRLDKLYRQFKPSETAKQKSEDSSQILTVINELRNRILNLETAPPRNLPSGLSQEEIDQAIKISEKKTIDREHTIENSVHGGDDKIKQMEIQFAQLLTRFERLPNPITHTDVNQMILNQIQNLKRTQQDNSEWKNLALEAINKVIQLENQLQQIAQSTKDYITRPTVEELINRAKLTQQPTSQTNINFDQRFNELERRVNTIPSSTNLSLIEQRLIQLENHSRNVNDQPKLLPQKQIRDTSGDIQSLQQQITELNGKKLDHQQISQILDDMKQRSQQELQVLFNSMSDLLKTKLDHQKATQLIEKSEAHLSQQINVLQQFVNDNQYALRKMQNDLKNLNHPVDQQPTTTISRLSIKSKSKEDTFIDTLTSKELQTIMPFIEFLPTFDMFNENEWN